MSDLIDRQALLRQIDIDSDGEPGYYGDTWKFIDTIKRMPSALGTNLAEVGTDCISRQAAIDAIDECYCGGEDSCGEPKRGKWLPDNNNYINEQYVCSECKNSFKVDTCMGKPMWNFCPYCGAKMER